MSLFEFILVYAVCWWLVLFMVLPFGAQAPVVPGKGHAPSAPANPRLKKKMMLTTVLALIPPLLFWGITSANATDPGMFKTNSGASAKDCATYQPDDSINATDTDATMGNGVGKQFEEVPTFLDAPASDYTKNGQMGDNFGTGIVQMGVVTTNTKTGETRLNGEPIGGTTDCQ